MKYVFTDRKFKIAAKHQIIYGHVAWRWKIRSKINPFRYLMGKMTIEEICLYEPTTQQGKKYASYTIDTQGRIHDS